MNRKPEKYKDKYIEMAVSELEGYRARSLQIMRLRERKLQIENDIYCVKAVDYSKAPVQGGTFKDMVVHTALKWAEIDDKLFKAIAESEKEMFLIEERIKHLRFEEQQVISLFYIGGKNIDATARAMNMSYEGVKKLKRRALQHYSEFFKGGAA